MTCSAMQNRMTSVLAGAADRRERLEVEAHAARCARCATAYADLLTASVALQRAYAPLRSETVSLSPARVRLALRRPEPAPAFMRVGRLSARLTEVALAAAVTAFAFVGSASVAPKSSIVDETAPDTTPAQVSEPADGAIVHLFRIGRYAATPDLVEPAVELPAHEEADTLPDPRDRAGLRR